VVTGPVEFPGGNPIQQGWQESMSFSSRSLRSVPPLRGGFPVSRTCLSVLEALHIPLCYALKHSPAFLEAKGGIKNNHHMEVFVKEDHPIQGLYAAGVKDNNIYSGILG
jgi:hypothetical protein